MELNKVLIVKTEKLLGIKGYYTDLGEKAVNNQLKTKQTILGINGLALLDTLSDNFFRLAMEDAEYQLRFSS